MKWDKYHRDLLADNWQWNGDDVYEQPITPLVSLRVVAVRGIIGHVGADNPIEARRFGSWDLIVRTATFAAPNVHVDVRICTYRDFGHAARAVLGNF